MRLCTLEFIVREAGVNIRRNMLMSLACVTTVAVTLGVSAFIVLAFRNVDNVLHRVAQELVVAAYLNTDVDTAGRTMVGKEIAAIPDVHGQPILVSKEHAWRTFSATIPDTLKGEVDDNPLPDTFMIRVDTPAHVPAVAQQVAALPEVEKVNAPYLEARRAGAIIRFARVASTSMTILMVFITTFLVMNTIRLTLYARRQEIRVMQLVGATNGYIRTPFILEGLVLGAVGGLVACLAVAAGYPYLLNLAHRALAFDLPLLNPGRNMFPFYGDVVGLGAVVG
ncbi:MAG: ABC transporter permease, partial [Chloroflexi bacterium]|nr:ABC transporter permease [Chloroflexota bacterium]